MQVYTTQKTPLVTVNIQFNIGSSDSALAYELQTEDTARVWWREDLAPSYRFPQLFGDTDVRVAVYQRMSLFVKHACNVTM